MLSNIVMHGAKEYWSRLQCLFDIDRVIRSNPAIDWETTLGRCEREGTKRILLVGLALSELFFDTPLDESIYAGIVHDPIIPPLVWDRATAIFDPKRRHFTSPSTLTKEWLRMLPRPTDKVRYVLRTAFTPRIQTFEMLPLPDRYFYTYYLIKPIHDYLALPLWRAAKGITPRSGR
jgi:hypothetical protein